jgi:general secretion pathway protein D
MNAARIPGFGDIPVLGRLFANQEDKKDKTEIVLAITPRILNNIRRPESELSEYWSGTELSINDRPQIVVPGAAGSGTGRNTPQRQTAAPAEPPIAQEESQNQPQTPEPAPTPAATPLDSSNPTGSGQPQPLADPFTPPTGLR